MKGRLLVPAVAAAELDLQLPSTTHPSLHQCGGHVSHCRWDAFRCVVLPAITAGPCELAPAPTHGLHISHWAIASGTGFDEKPQGPGCMTMLSSSLGDKEGAAKPRSKKVHKPQNKLSPCISLSLPLYLPLSLCLSVFLSFLKHYQAVHQLLM